MPSPGAGSGAAPLQRPAHAAAGVAHGRCAEVPACSTTSRGGSGRDGPSRPGKLYADQVQLALASCGPRINMLRRGSTNRLSELESEINTLRKRLAEYEAEAKTRSDNGGLDKCGWVWRHKAYAGLLEREWEPVFAILAGTRISLFTELSGSTHRNRPATTLDSAMDISNCSIEVEGMKKRRFYTFSLVGDDGDTVLRLSTESVGEGKQWVAHLRRMGCPLLLDGQKDTQSYSSPQQPPMDGDKSHELSEGSSDSARYLTQASRRVSKVKTHAIGDEKEKPTPLSPPKTPSKKPKRRTATPVHLQNAPSLLSSEAAYQQRHGGLINLATVIILATNFRLILENLLKYGILVRPYMGFWFSFSLWKEYPVLLVLPVEVANPLCSYLLEVAALRWPRFLPYLPWAHACSICFWFTIATCLLWEGGKGGGNILLNVNLHMLSVIGVLKLISYAHTNADLRRGGPNATGPAKAMIEQYPGNITLGNMAYFMLVPTLCYQPSYPRSKKIRKHWLLRRLAEFLICCAVLMFLVEQYVEPTISNTLDMAGSRGFSMKFLMSMGPRILKLSIPTLYCWLVLFYGFFHAWLNILAELLQFGDREFYKDWWNAPSIAQYWRTWNIPVHTWAVRHLYVPLVNRGVSKQGALMLVFLFSAILHEVIISVPLHMFRLYAFSGMLLQAPLIVITDFIHKRLRREDISNMFFWFFFCFLGQPLGLFLYWQDYLNASKS
eukprot:scaffold2754_cov388-Prasinococcus_capsulatus_cf.AAC.3